MTLIKGAYIKGVRGERARSFASIPGLIMWCEADYGVELDSNNFVVKVADRSGRQNDIVGSRPSFRSTEKIIGIIVDIEVQIKKRRGKRWYIVSHFFKLKNFDFNKYKP
jgi:hypothetical protein